MKTYTLNQPITVMFRGPGGVEREEVITEVKVREPKAKDLRAAESETGEVGQAIALIARLTSLEPFQVDELCVQDFTALGAIVGDFFRAGQVTGATSSAI